MARRRAAGRAAQSAGARRAARGTAVAGRLAYLDSSAFVKLPLREGEHAALRRELARWSGMVSSSLLRVEAPRACARYGSRYVERVHLSLARVSLVAIDDLVLERAADLDPLHLRSLDAVHLATALSLGRDLGVMFVYDGRLRAAAAAAGLETEAPT